eukprot:TRINITY_DN3435_c0_g1_i1.p1 TRINITY_DN3435_c0_g1~~TRINITY_DN3435_c0_g1_i1.p1  ORF type:complete len:463 (-),score=79.35 TRINITY_DN3435_c0_g1_i1:73-1461(-)
MSVTTDPVTYSPCIPLRSPGARFAFVLGTSHVPGKPGSIFTLFESGELHYFENPEDESFLLTTLPNFTERTTVVKFAPIGDINKDTISDFVIIYYDEQEGELEGLVQTRIAVITSVTETKYEIEMMLKYPLDEEFLEVGIAVIPVQVTEGSIPSLLIGNADAYKVVEIIDLNVPSSSSLTHAEYWSDCVSNGGCLVSEHRSLLCFRQFDSECGSYLIPSFIPSMPSVIRQSFPSTITTSKIDNILGITLAGYTSNSTTTTLYSIHFLTDLIAPKDTVKLGGKNITENIVIDEYVELTNGTPVQVEADLDVFSIFVADILIKVESSNLTVRSNATFKDTTLSVSGGELDATSINIGGCLDASSSELEISGVVGRNGTITVAEYSSACGNTEFKTVKITTADGQTYTSDDCQVVPRSDSSFGRSLYVVAFNFDCVSGSARLSPPASLLQLLSATLLASFLMFFA